MEYRGDDRRGCKGVVSAAVGIPASSLAVQRAALPSLRLETSKHYTLCHDVLLFDPETHDGLFLPYRGNICYEESIS